MRTNLVVPEIRVSDGQWATDMSLKFKFSWWAPKMHVLYNTVCNGHSSSPKVVDFGNNRKCICDFLLVINSNFGPILHVI